MRIKFYWLIMATVLLTGCSDDQDAQKTKVNLMAQLSTHKLIFEDVAFRISSGINIKKSYTTEAEIAVDLSNAEPKIENNVVHLELETPELLYNRINWGKTETQKLKVSPWKRIFTSASDLERELDQKEEKRVKEIIETDPKLSEMSKEQATLTLKAMYKMAGFEDVKITWRKK